MNSIWMVWSVALAAAPAEWKVVETQDGMTVSSRSVEKSSYVELQVLAFTTYSVDALCTAAYSDGTIDPKQPTTVRERRVLREGDNERVVYELAKTPIVSDRDLVVLMRRASKEDGSCSVVFEATDELAPPLRDGVVRITRLKSSWLFAPLPNGKTRAVHQIWNEPGGSVPVFLAEGGRRQIAKDWMKFILEKAGRVALKSDSSAPAH